VTPDEVEAKINRLGEQLAQLEQQRDDLKKLWSQCTLVGVIATLVLAVLTLSISVLDLVAGKSSPLAVQYGSTMLVALFIAIAYFRAAATLTVRRGG